MKNLFFFLLLPLLALSCKGVEQYRAGIEELSGKWDTTTKSLTDFSGMVSTDMSNYTKALAAMKLDEATTKKLKPEQVQSWEAAQKIATDALSQYVPLQKTISDYIKTWTEKTKDVNDLKEGLAAGKLEGDVTAKIAELNTMVSGGEENLKAWIASYATIKNGVARALTNVQKMMTSYSDPAAAAPTLKPTGVKK